MKWGIVYYRTAAGSVPGSEFLTACPTAVRAKLVAVLEAVRDAPPPAFSGGGMWEAMHGEMGGYYEVRRVGPDRTHYRLYCVLENGTAGDLETLGFAGPQIAVISGLKKANATLFTDADYKKHVRDLGDDYRGTVPRRIATP